MKKKIYIAGKYDDDNVVKVLCNIRLGIKTAIQALLDGYIPFCPFLDFNFVLLNGTGTELTQQHFRDYSMAWLPHCDEVWVMHNWKTSGGTKAEIAEAEKLGIPVKYL